MDNLTLKLNKLNGHTEELVEQIYDLTMSYRFRNYDGKIEDVIEELRTNYDRLNWFVEGVNSVEPDTLHFKPIEKWQKLPDVIESVFNNFTTCGMLPCFAIDRKYLSSITY